MTIKISVEQRDLLYEELLTHLSGVDALRLAIDAADFDTANRLAGEFSDELRLICDDLGWGELHGVEEVELTTPRLDLQRVLGRVRKRAHDHFTNQELEVAAAREPLEQARLLIETCDAVCAALDHSEMSPSS